MCWPHIRWSRRRLLILAAVEFFILAAALAWALSATAQDTTSPATIGDVQALNWNVVSRFNNDEARIDRLRAEVNMLNGVRHCFNGVPSVNIVPPLSTASASSCSSTLHAATSSTPSSSRS